MILSNKEHDELTRLFPRVNCRCPVCYIDQAIEYKLIKKGILKEKRG